MRGHRIGIRVVIGLMPLLSSACGVASPQVMPAPMRVSGSAQHGYCFDWEQHVRDLIRAYGWSSRQEESVAARGPELELPIQPPLIADSDIKGRWSGVEPSPATRRPRTTEEVLDAFAHMSHDAPKAESTVRTPSNAEATGSP